LSQGEKINPHFFAFRWGFSFIAAHKISFILSF